MTDLEMLKCTKKIKELLESGWNSEADEELGKIIDKLKVDLSM